VAGGEVIKELLVALGVDADTGDLEAFDFALGAVTAAAEIAAAAVAALAIAVAGAVAATVEAGSAAQEGALKTGLSTQAYQELAYAAQQAGVPMELLEASLSKQTKLANDAANGNEQAAAAFEALGISVTNADGSLKSSEQLFSETAAALAAIEDPAKRAAAAQAIYGESAAKLMPLLAAGPEGMAAMRAEAEALGVVLSDEDVAAADAFGDSMDMLIGVVRGLAFDIGTALLPFLQKLVDSFKEWYLANHAMISGGLDILATLLGAVFRVVGSVLSVVNDIIESTIGWENVIKIATAALALLATVIAGVTLALGALVAVVGGLISAVGIFLGVVSGMLPLLLAVVAVFSAIASAVTGFVLVLEDLYTYLQGGDSLIGRFLDKWRESDGVLGSVARLFDALINLGRTLFAALAPIGDAGSAAFDKLLQKLAPVLDMAARLASFLAGQLAPVIDKIASGINAISGGVSAVTGTSPGATGGDAAASAGIGGAFSASAAPTAATSSAAVAPTVPTSGGGASGGPSSTTLNAGGITLNGLGINEEQARNMIREGLEEFARTLSEAHEGAPA
jgi:hypothetical protein